MGYLNGKMARRLLFAARPPKAGRWVGTEDQLAKRAAEGSNKSGRLLVLFFASHKPDPPYDRWCPDCTAAEAVINTAAQSADRSTLLLQVDIERKAWKENPGPEHPFRSAPFEEFLHCCP